MATTHRTHTCARRALRLGACVALVATALLIQPFERPAVAGASNLAAAATRSTKVASYGWPVKPFFKQHPVRGFFGDPRIGMTPRGMTHTFHFGIDISSPNGTAVYATLDGEAHLESFRPEVVAVRSADRHVEHQYWHIRPAIRHGQRVAAYRTIVGYVEAPWAHVHFAEMRDGRYVNPLRQGALGPFVDDTRPVLRNLRLERAGRALTGRSLTGVVDLVVEASDTTPLAVPAPWNDKPVTPALLRWRLVRNGQATQAWSIAADVRATIPSNDRYDAVYATWTRQNKASHRGRYRFYLAHGLDASKLAAGSYEIEVEAIDTRGNRTASRFPVAVR